MITNQQDESLILDIAFERREKKKRSLVGIAAAVADDKKH